MVFLKKLFTVLLLLVYTAHIPALEAQQEAPQEDMITLVKNALDTFYARLSSKEQEVDLNNLFNALIEKGAQIQEYCDNGLKQKYNHLMLKYRDYTQTKQLCLNVSFGCTIQNNDPIVCRDNNLLEIFDLEHYLNNEILKEFNNHLHTDEQEELKIVITDMYMFCKNTINDLDTLLNQYPTIKSKLQQLLAETNQELLITIGFDYPFPTIIYKIA